MSGHDQSKDVEQDSYLAWHDDDAMSGDEATQLADSIFGVSPSPQARGDEWYKSNGKVQTT